MDRVSVVGLGKLGACLAATFAQQGFRVVGVDVNAQTVAQVNLGRAPVCEPGLDAMISSNQNRLTATTDYEDAIASTDITFILVPTPSDQRGAFSLKHVKAATRSVGRALKDKSAYHLVVIQSTVLPGSTQSVILPLLEEESGKTCGHDFGLCHIPEFVALGTVLRDMLKPSFVVVGEHDQEAGELVEAVYRRYLLNDPPIWRMSPINAELTKIALNAYVTMKISFANTLAEVCERLPGGDVDAVTRAVGSDPRVGSRYFSGGMRFAGPCFPRDTKSFAFFLRQVGVEPLQIEATDAQNQTITPRVVASVKNAIGGSNARTIAVLGLAFKPGTAYVGDSPGMDVAETFAGRGFDVIVYDSVAEVAAREILGEQVRYANTVEECLQQADAVVIATPDPEFCALGAASFPRKNPPVIVYDCWRVLRDQLETTSHLHYVPLGIGLEDRQHLA